MTLSLDSVLLMVSCEVRFEERRAESVVSSSVSVGGYGEDSGGRDGVVAGVEDGRVANGAESADTVTEVTALQRDDSSSSPASSAYLAGGKIFCVGRKDITVVYRQWGEKIHI
jgi:hypothetical protein